MIEIKHRVNGNVLYTAENASDVKTALEEAVKVKADLGGANLRGANLRDADLRGANLRGANLRDADLRDANLRDANLRDANLRGANLRDADLRDANLRDANLWGANLRDANLRDANLGDANLRYRHPLWPFWADFNSILDQAPAEVAGLRAAIVEGRIDGSAYEGECACLVGTIAKVRHVALDQLDLPRDGSRPAEQWFIPIRKGDIPLDDPAKATDSEGVYRASVALRWVDEWVASRQFVAAALWEAKTA